MLTMVLMMVKLVACMHKLETFFCGTLLLRWSLQSGSGRVYFRVGMAMTTGVWQRAAKTAAAVALRQRSTTMPTTFWVLGQGLSSTRRFAAALDMSSAAPSAPYISSSGVAEEQALKSAADRVIASGGQLLPSTADAALHRKELGDDLENACDSIAQFLGLGDVDKASLVDAAKRGEGTVESFQDVRCGKAVRTQYGKCSVARDDHFRLHCVYGRYTAELKLDGSAAGVPPPENCVEVHGRRFAVLPSRPPSDYMVGYDMVVDQDDNWLDIPPGWRPYDAGEDFRVLVLPQVVAAHGWGTDLMLILKDGKWTGWKTGLNGRARAGQRASSHIEWFETDTTGRKCVFRGEDPTRYHRKGSIVFYQWAGRMLMEQVPRSELLKDWKSYVRLQAKVAWDTMERSAAA